MNKCECGAAYPDNSHYGISIDKFGKCVDCLVTAGEFDESRLAQIELLASEELSNGALLC